MKDIFKKFAIVIIIFTAIFAPTFYIINKSVVQQEIVLREKLASGEAEKINGIIYEIDKVCKEGYVNNRYIIHGVNIFIPNFKMKDGQLVLEECKGE